MRHQAIVVALAVAGMQVTGAMAQPVAEPVVTVELSSFKFTPDRLTLQHGHSYRLHLSNTSSGGHNFVAKEFFAASTIASEDRGKVTGGKVDVASGRAVDLRLTPNTPGTFKVRCSHFMHSSFGMTGTIVVE